jgi:hypothetical protein
MIDKEATFWRSMINHRKKGTDIIENFFYISDVKKIDTKSHRFVGK